VPERIMALADIFEALTSTDRPYMPPKSLSRAIGSMGSMCRSGHLCPDLSELFLWSGAYRRYADRHLKPEQLDDVDIDGVLGENRPRAS
jgi:HD-GYP domain-containing protein (c-di-GMP phosphodiesterase class II)